MRTLADHLTRYARYHQDGRNLAAHFVGTPLIALAVAMLLSRPAWEVYGLALTPALVVGLLAMLFYVRLDRRFALAMAVQWGLCLWAGHWMAMQDTGTWLKTAVGLWVVGWTVQLIGHLFESRKPAFMDQLLGVLVGPLFLTAKVAFALGLRTDMYADIRLRLALR
jgi:uncharacterized membrane protein YGL010W